MPAESLLKSLAPEADRRVAPYSIQWSPAKQQVEKWRQEHWMDDSYMEMRFDLTSQYVR